jgi:hypothetical protein
MTPRRFLGGCIAIFFVAIALVCFAAPVARPAIDDGWGLLDDTRAWFGAGTAEGVPNVSQVSCFRRQFGSTSTSRRSGGMSDWNCTIYLGPPDERSQDDPWAGMSPEDAYQEYMRRMNEYSDSLLVRSQGEGRIERVLATNRTGTLPTLRRLSSDRFGVIWGGGELAGRWIAWALLSAVLIGIGVLSLIGARAVRRRVL